MKTLAIFVGLTLCLVGLTRPAEAASNAFIGVTATGDELDISISPDAYDFGSVSSGYEITIPNTYFTLTNNGLTWADISIKATDMVGGLKTWTLSNVGNPGVDTYALRVNLQDDSFATLGFAVGGQTAIGFSGSDEQEAAGFCANSQIVTHTDAEFIDPLPGTYARTMGFKWDAPTNNLTGSGLVAGTIVFTAILSGFP